MVLDIITNEMENRFQENDSDILGALLDLLNSKKPDLSGFSLALIRAMNWQLQSTN